MNLEDKKKFIDVCVEITKYGKIEPCNITEVEQIIKRIDETYVNGFEKFLYAKSDLPEFEDPDVWDEWYDNLTLAEIDEKDIQIYNLPSDKIKIALNNEETLIFTIFNYAKDFVEGCRPFLKPKEHNITAGYAFEEHGIFIEFYSPGDKMVTVVSEKGKSKQIKYAVEIRTKVDELFSIFKNKVESELKRFNELQGEENVNIWQYTTNQVSPDYHTARCMFITPEDLYYPNKNAVTKEYIHSFFHIINEKEYIK